MLDDELISEMEQTLPDIPHVFISSFSNLGIQQLKDLLWKELNEESNKLSSSIDSIVHRHKDVSKIQEELEEEGEDMDFEYVDEEGDDIEEDWDDDIDFEYIDEGEEPEDDGEK